MDTTNIQPSFIPKKSPTQSAVPGQPRQSMSFFTIIAGVVFLTVVVLAGVVFGFEQYLKGSIEKKKVVLDAELKKFEQPLVDELALLDKKLVYSKDLLYKHISYSAFFNYLGSVTLRTVRFNNFSFIFGEDGNLKVTMNGEANNFASVALQAEEFKKPEHRKNLTDTAFSGLTLTESGAVGFSLKATINPESFYYPLIAKSSAASSRPATTTVTATSTGARTQ